MSYCSSDRNLLFGILAMQMDFISREDLIAATSVWVKDKSRPIDEILVEQERLPEDERELMVALVEKHLQKHDNDSRKSLESISVVSSGLKEELSRLADADVEASMGHVSAAQDARDQFATQSFSIGDATSEGARFRVLRPHAKGGLGQVSVAMDEELHREVALKEIQAERADDPMSRERFVREAEVTGALEHPGIVPVYGLGQYADGRPFYAMRFVKGDSLRAAITQFHRKYAAESQMAEQALELRQLLRRFIDVCNAIEYAHSRGVLHRDLKPGNIMLGKYGETLVVDWGLAKLVDRPDNAPELAEPAVNVGSGSGVGQTMQGKALGTPAYMSPEQAAGRLDVLGARSDVYSLGATLYTLLTGQSAFDPDEDEVLQMVQDGEFQRPSELNTTIPKPLEAICLKAMALEPQNRYETPVELANDVERFLADEPVTAAKDPLTTQAMRWARRHKAACLSSVAALLVAAISLAISTVLIGHQKGLLKEKTETAVAAQKEAVKNAGAAKAATKLAAANLATAQERLAKSYTQSGLEAAKRGDYAAAMRLYAEAAVTRESLDGAPIDNANRMRCALAEAQLPQMLTVLEMDSDPNKQLIDVHFDRGGKFVVGLLREIEREGVYNDVVVRWDVASGETRFRRVLSGACISMALRPDGRWLACQSRRPTLDSTRRDGMQCLVLDCATGEIVDIKEILQNEIESSSVGQTAPSQELNPFATNPFDSPPLPPPNPVSLTSITFDPLNRWFVTQMRCLPRRTESWLWNVSGHNEPVVRSFSGRPIFTTNERIVDSEVFRRNGFLGRSSRRSLNVDDGLLVVPGGDGAYRYYTVPSSKRFTVGVYAEIPFIEIQRVEYGRVSGLPIAVSCRGDRLLVDTSEQDMTRDSRRHRGQLRETESAYFHPHYVLWDVRTGEPLPGLSFSDEIQFGSADGRFFVTSQHGQYLLWEDALGLPCSQERVKDGPIASMAIGGVTESLLTSSWGGDAKMSRLFDESNSVGQLPHGGTVKDTVWCHNGRFVASGGSDKTMCLWDSNSGSLVKRLPLDGLVSCLCASDTWLAAATENGSVSIYETNSQDLSLVASFSVTATVMDIAVSKKHDRAFVGCGDGSVYAWNVSSKPPKPLVVASGHEFVLGIAIAEAAKRLIVARGAGTFELYDLDQFNQVAQITYDEPITSLNVSPNGTHSILTSHDGTARIWNLEAGQPTGEPLRHESSVLCAAFEGDGRWVATGDETGKILLWGCHSGQSLGVQLEAGSDVRHLAFSKGGRVLVAACGNGNLIKWVLPPPCPVPKAAFRSSVRARTLTDIDGGNAPCALKDGEIGDAVRWGRIAKTRRTNSQLANLLHGWASQHGQSGDWEEARTAIWSSIHEGLDETTGLQLAVPTQYARLWYPRNKVRDVATTEEPYSVPDEAHVSYDEATLSTFEIPSRAFSALASPQFHVAVDFYRRRLGKVASEDAPTPPKAPIIGRRFILPGSAIDEQLKELIIRHVAPRSWESAGGRGRILANKSMLDLFVSQTRDNLTTIESLLAALCAPEINDQVIRARSGGQVHGVYRRPARIPDIEPQLIEKLLSTSPNNKIYVDRWMNDTAYVVTADSVGQRLFQEFIRELADYCDNPGAVRSHSVYWRRKIVLNLIDVPLNDLPKKLTSATGVDVRFDDSLTKLLQQENLLDSTISIEQESVLMETAMRDVQKRLASLLETASIYVAFRSNELVFTFADWGSVAGTLSCRLHEIPNVYQNANDAQFLTRIASLVVVPDMWDRQLFEGNVECLEVLLSSGETSFALAVTASQQGHLRTVDMMSRLVQHGGDQNCTQLRFVDSAVNDALAVTASVRMRDVPLERAIEDLSTRTGLLFFLDSDAIHGIGLSEDTSVNLELANVSVRTILREMLYELNLEYYVHEGSVVVTSEKENQRRLQGIAYPLHKLLPDAKHAHNELCSLITIHCDPSSWRKARGLGEANVLGATSTLVAFNKPSVLERIKTLMSALQTSSGIAPSQVAAPLPPRISHALSMPLTIMLSEERTLSELAKELTSLIHVPVLIDVRALDDVGLGRDTPLFCEANNVLAEEFLRASLAELDLTYVAETEAIRITTLEEADNELTLQLYPVQDFLSNWDDPASNQTTRIEMDELCKVIAPLVSNDIPGFGSIYTYQPLQLLWIQQFPEVHEQILAVLTSLRDRKATQPIHVEQTQTDAIRMALASPVSTMAGEHQLCSVVDSLKDQLNVNIYIDNRALDGVGLGSDTMCEQAFLQDVPLDTALSITLNGLGLAYAIRDNAILVTEYGDVEHALYPISDLLATGIDSETLTRELPRCLAVETVDVFMRKPALQYFGVIESLCLRGSIQEHRDLRRMLSMLRNRAKITEQVLRLERALQGPYSWRFDDAAPAVQRARITRREFISSMLLEFKERVEFLLPWDIAVDVTGDLSPNATWQEIMKLLELDYFLRGDSLVVCDKSQLSWNVLPVASLEIDNPKDFLQSLKEEVDFGLEASEEQSPLDGFYPAISHIGDCLLIRHTPTIQRRIFKWVAERSAGGIAPQGADKK